jgi:hypothetical protein
MNHHRWPRRSIWVAVLAVVCLAAAGTALAASSRSARPATADPGKVALQHRLAALRKQNAQLRSFSPAGVARLLGRTKAALEKYQSVDQAKADGYAAAGPCAFSVAGAGEESSHPGGMGVHFTNDAVMKSGKLDPMKPPVLVYAPVANGGLQLVAAEYFKPDADQNVKTDDDRPTLFGRAFDGPMLGHSPGMPIHYDLHVWLWKHNPSGMFAPWNPDVSCS